MHLGNSIICPVTGIPMIGIMAGFAVYAFKKARNEFDKTKILPVISATIFIFALQMINFSIPQATSSGHIIGGILLCLLLGKYLGFFAMGVILLIQCLFFNDGSITAYGCNLFNMGFLACFIAYPYIYKPLEKKNKYIAVILASIAALELAALAAGVELFISGAIKNKIMNFGALMQIIHLPIGIVEGVFSASILYLIEKINIKKISYIFILSSVVLAGFIYKYASNKPDGLEWSLLNTPVETINNTNNLILNLSSIIQNKLCVLNPVLLNYTAIAAIGLIMFLICMILSVKAPKTNGNKI